MWLELTLPSEAPVEESILLCQGHMLLSLAWLSSCLPAAAQLLFTVGPGGQESCMVWLGLLALYPVVGLLACSLPALPQPPA